MNAQPRVFHFIVQTGNLKNSFKKDCLSLPSTSWPPMSLSLTGSQQVEPLSQPITQYKAPKLNLTPKLNIEANIKPQWLTPACLPSYQVFFSKSDVWTGYQCPSSKHTHMWTVTVTDIGVKFGFKYLFWCFLLNLICLYYCCLFEPTL